MVRRLIWSVIATGLVGAGGFLAGCAPPGDLIVTKSADTNDGVCNADCSLREAVHLANTRPGRDTVRLALASLSLVGDGEDANATGDLDVTGDLVVEADPRVDEAIIRANRIDRILDVHAGVVELRRLRLEGGVAGDDTGGGIRNRSALTLVDVVVSGGGARTGGAIDSNNPAGGTPSLTLLRTTIEFNFVGEEGGGINSRGTLRIEDSRITDNVSGGGFGAGVFTAGDAVIRNTVISDNDSADCGGGIASGGTLEMRGSTIEFNHAALGAGIDNFGTLTVVGGKIRSNRAEGSGGGIANMGPNASALVDGTEIAANIADSDDRVSDDFCLIGAEDGGGLFNQGTFALRNATVAFNDDLTGGAPDCAGTYRDRGGNVIGDITGCTLVPSAESSRGLDLKLG